VQESLESAEKEMGGKTLTLEELDKLLTEQGVNTKNRDTAFRIAADDTTRLIYISGII
jgi:DNA excision repair protein ERCC-5